MSRTARVLTLVAAVVVLAGIAVGYTLHAVDRAARRDRPRAGGPRVSSGAVQLAAAPGDRRMVFRNTAWGPHRDELASVPADHPGGPRTASGVTCLRFHAAAGTGICLRAVHGALQDSYRAVVLDSRLRERRHYALSGIPTRARVSPDGRMAAWTVFVSGDSYAGTDFSTRTSVLDTRTWTLQDSLEKYRIIKDGHAYRAVDANFWGVTFADDDHFYATLATRGRTHLVRGDVRARTVRTLRENVECPSLSPGGTRIAFKKRVPGLPADAPWRLYTLDLGTLRETALAERRNVDDQAVWVDGNTVAYSLPGDYGANLWSVPADGGGRPRRLLDAGLAPAFIGAGPTRSR
ncbi:TolB family protein [Wenjunlia tyrosinilytica]|uniref:TolB-like translocation protein signal peptide n=1 Tax=Wenjunlia tyrosinilytica TaxID=1544741 RepID=A0A918DXP3_9ACTN|nr:TolB-like translocation protein [Wenjunlia tyrosinilytica]GGO87511.1 TolB-like translocation protein; signal peptide [Wenjunlia tyrosinilytica]